MKSKIYLEEYKTRFSTITDPELVELFNKEVGNKGWGTARASYLGAIHDEFIKRDIDYSAIGDETSISLKNTVSIQDKLISIIST